jgi:hypothetical protein
LGSHFAGLDVKTLDDTTFGIVYSSVARVQRPARQPLEIDDLRRYSRRFGVLVPHPSKMTRHPYYPEITMLRTNKFDASRKLNVAIYRRGTEDTRCARRRGLALHGERKRRIGTRSCWKPASPYHLLHGGSSRPRAGPVTARRATTSSLAAVALSRTISVYWSVSVSRLHKIQPSKAS